MAVHCLLRTLLVSYFLHLLLAQEDLQCPQNTACGQLGNIHFPFTSTTNRECGLLISGCGHEHGDKKVLLGEEWYLIEGIDQNDEGYNSMLVQDNKLRSFLSSRNCSLQIDVFYNPEFGHPDDNLAGSFSNCLSIQLPTGPQPNFSNPSEFRIQVTVSPECRECGEKYGGQCRLSDEEKFTCADPKDRPPNAEEKPRDYSKNTIRGLAIGFSFVIIILILVVILLLYKRRYTSPDVQNQSKNIYPDSNPNQSPVGSSVFFGIPIFSYESPNLWRY